MIFSVKNNSSGIAIFPAGREGHIFMETGVPYVPYRHKRRRPPSLCVYMGKGLVLHSHNLFSIRYIVQHTQTLNGKSKRIYVEKKMKKA